MLKSQKKADPTKTVSLMSRKNLIQSILVTSVALSGFAQAMSANPASSETTQTEATQTKATKTAEISPEKIADAAGVIEVEAKEGAKEKEEEEAAPADYLHHEAYPAFRAKMIEKHGFAGTQLDAWFSGLTQHEGILKAIQRPAEKTKTWADYQDIFLTKSRTEGGVKFWNEHREVLERAEATYGVPAAIIVAIIGVETKYGKHKGSYRILQSLATLGFDYPRRGAFFLSEMEAYLNLARDLEKDPTQLKGSYAGAMGYPQFISSSYQHYAVDFDNDGKTDLFDNTTDAIGSVANYFAKHGWKTNAPVTQPIQVKSKEASELLKTSNIKLKPYVTIGEVNKLVSKPQAWSNMPTDTMTTVMALEGKSMQEFWIGWPNFYVITRYNHSKLYAMAIHQLSLAIEAMQQDQAHQ